MSAISVVHERLHFDITETIARELRQEVRVRGKTGRHVGCRARRATAAAFAEEQRTQQRYDDEDEGWAAMRRRRGGGGGPSTPRHRTGRGFVVPVGFRDNRTTREPDGS